MLCCAKSFSQVCLFVTVWTTAHEAPPSISRGEYWSGPSCPPLRGLPNLGIQLESVNSPALTGGSFTVSSTCVALYYGYLQSKKVLES